MLKYRADIRTLGFVTTYFGLTALLWLSEPVWWLQVPLIITTCFFAWFCAVITHNTIHCPIFHKRWANKAFQVVLTQCYGHPVSTFVAGHNLSHHKHTQQAKDVMRTTKMRFQWNALNGLLFFFWIAPGILRGERQFIKTMRTRKPRWFRQLIIEAFFLFGVMAVLAVIDWKKFLLYWYLPHFWAGWGIVTINLLQHDGCDADSEYNHSRNFVGKFFGWWTFNNGFHGVHHMHPTLHWSLTRQAHNELFKPHIHPNLDEPSIFKYWWRAYVWPCKRLRYDGAPVMLPPREADLDWVPKAGQPLQQASLGAES
jgi:fatty acid desaturase